MSEYSFHISGTPFIPILTFRDFNNSFTTLQHAGMLLGVGLCRPYTAQSDEPGFSGSLSPPSNKTVHNFIRSVPYLLLQEPHAADSYFNNSVQSVLFKVCESSVYPNLSVYCLVNIVSVSDCVQFIQVSVSICVLLIQISGSLNVLFIQVSVSLSLQFIQVSVSLSLQFIKVSFSLNVLFL